MSDHLTEEEQLENLKRLWKEYGLTIIATVVIATGGYFGWNYWQDQQRIKAETSSSLFDQLMTAAVDKTETQLQDDARRATVEHLAEQIKGIDSSSIYAQQAALFRAREAVLAEDYAQASTDLQWVVDNAKDAAIVAVAKVRLARVMLAQNNYDQALMLLDSAATEGFSAELAEVRGDALRLKGDTLAAGEAYQQALDNIDNDQQRSLIIQMKIDDLKIADNQESGA
ncbi:MAG TPA: tetratricopeptide repeat protein [Cellvibrionaceae bacterium]